MSCTTCIEDLEHCHETLVLHADGTLECEGVERCGGDEVLHECSVACTDLGCGCLGDELPPIAWFGGRRASAVSGQDLLLAA